MAGSLELDARVHAVPLHSPAESIRRIFLKKGGDKGAAFQVFPPLAEFLEPPILITMSA